MGKQEITTSLLSLLKFTEIPNNETQIFVHDIEYTKFEILCCSKKNLNHDHE